MQALSVIGATAMNAGIAPKSSKTGGTSKEDPNAGGGVDPDPIHTKPMTTKDKAGAGILTVLAIILIVGGAFWITI